MNATAAYNRNQVHLAPFDHEAISVGASAVGLTVSKASKAWHAYIKCDGAMIRYWKDGTLPTSVDGYPLFDGEQVELENKSELLNFRAIRVGSVNPTLWVDYAAGLF